MKRHITYLIMFLFLCNTNAQQAMISYDGEPSFHYVDIGKFQILDYAHLKCMYQLTYVKDTLKPENKSIDIQTLLIGENISKYYSQYKLDYFKFVKKYLKSHDTYPSNTKRDAWCMEFYKNYPENKETVTDIGSILYSNCIYEENSPQFNWILCDEKQSVLSYSCNKATTTFNGREYVAWYTTEIPVNNGPWKFSGLPGLILKVYDTKNQFVFECKGLEMLKTKEPIYFYRVNYTKTSRTNLWKLYKRIYNDYAYYMTSNFNVIMKECQNGTRTIVNHSSYKMPYNPIELE